SKSSAIARHRNVMAATPTEADELDDLFVEGRFTELVQPDVMSAARDRQLLDNLSVQGRRHVGELASIHEFSGIRDRTHRAPEVAPHDGFNVDRLRKLWHDGAATIEQARLRSHGSSFS